MPLTLNDVAGGPRKVVRQKNAGTQAAVVSGPCRIFSAHWGRTTGPAAAPGSHGRVYDSLTAAGDHVKIMDDGNAYAFGGNRSMKNIYQPPGIQHSTGLSIEVVGSGTFVVSYSEG